MQETVDRLHLLRQLQADDANAIAELKDEIPF